MGSQSDQNSSVEWVQNSFIFMCRDMDYGANKISEPVLLGGTHKGERMLESGPFTTVEE